MGFFSANQLRPPFRIFRLMYRHVYPGGVAFFVDVNGFIYIILKRINLFRDQGLLEKCEWYYSIYLYTRGGIRFLLT